MLEKHHKFESVTFCWMQGFIVDTGTPIKILKADGHAIAENIVSLTCWCHSPDQMEIVDEAIPVDDPIKLKDIELRAMRL